MDETNLVRLNLCAPLPYAADPALTPFSYETGSGPTAGEQLFCFEIETGQSRSIEPDPPLFLGPLVFAARSAGAGQGTSDLRSALPAGQYLFAQERSALGREECISLAIEVQKDGLWEGLELEPRLYVRYLFEDGKPVSQLFRPYRRAASTI
jgi:hypothetical protein